MEIEILVPFNGMYARDRALVQKDDARVQGWITVGLARVVGSGEDPTGPGGTEPDDSGSLAPRAGGGSPASDEPGQGFGAGSYGAAQGVDKG